MDSLKKNFLTLKKNIEINKIERNRFLMILISTLFIIDYLGFCYLVNRNPFNIFPSFPIMDKKKQITLYLPDIDGKNIIKEERRVSIINDLEKLVRQLFEEVITGSNFKNTSIIVSVDIFIRKIWIYNNNCIIDIGHSYINKNSIIIPGSEKIFRKALKMTINKNIPSITQVIILERGIPGKNLWESAGI